MRYSVLPTRIEIYDTEMKNLVAVVEAVDEVCAKIEIRQVLGWSDWVDVSEGVRRAMILMGLKEEGSPHGH